MTEPCYTERLGVSRPRMEDHVGRPELRLVDLLAGCLLERGRPMPPEEVAERLAGLGVTAPTGDLVLSLKRAAASVASVRRDAEGRFVLLLDDPEDDLEWRLFQLRLDERAPSPGAERVAELKMTLAGSEPPIWRRVILPCAYTLADLHWVIQIVFDWDQAHLHAFQVRDKRYEVPTPLKPGMGEERALDASAVTLWELKLGVKGRSFEYLYDFGDNWLHLIEVVASGPLESGATYPVCVAGERAAPPEDCGGIGGFRRLLHVLADPENPEHGGAKEWLGEDFHPERFDRNQANERLRKAFARRS